MRGLTLGGGPLRIHVIGGIHGDERIGLQNLDRLILWCREDAPHDRVTLRVVRDANPDGSARGTRTNSHGVDLNRNWPSRNFRASPRRGSAPSSEPEVAALRADLERFDPDLVLVLHAARSGPFVNHDGPAEPWAELFSRAAHSVDPRWHLVADMGYPTPGSLGSYLGVDLGVPVLTIEFERGQSADSAWAALRRGLEALAHGPMSSENRRLR